MSATRRELAWKTILFSRQKSLSSFGFWYGWNSHWFTCNNNKERKICLRHSHREKRNPRPESRFVGTRTDLRYDTAVVHQIVQILDWKVAHTDWPARAVLQQLFHTPPSFVQCLSDVSYPTRAQRPMHHVEIYKADVEIVNRWMIDWQVKKGQKEQVWNHESFN